MKKLLSVTLVVSLLVVATSVSTQAGSVLKHPVAETAARDATRFDAARRKDPLPQSEKVKAKVAKLGTGEKAKAKVKLRSGEKLKGYISAAGENDFTIIDKKSGQSKTIAYSDVDEVGKPGLSKTTKIVLIVGIVVVATAAILAIVVVHGLHNLDFRGIAGP